MRLRIVKQFTFLGDVLVALCDSHLGLTRQGSKHAAVEFFA